MNSESRKDKINTQSLILPHGTHVGSQVLQNLMEPKRADSQKSSNDIFLYKYKKFVDEIKKLEIEYEINNEVYNSKYSFEPKIGETYHLYMNKNGEKFLSIIKPSEWNEIYLYSVVLNSDKIWNKI